MCSLLDRSHFSAGDFIDGTNHPIPASAVVPTGMSTDSEAHCFHRVQQTFHPVRDPLTPVLLIIGFRDYFFKIMQYM